MQTTSGGFLRTPIVDGFNLREGQRMRGCVVDIMLRFVAIKFMHSPLVGPPPQNSTEENQHE